MLSLRGGSTAPGARSRQCRRDARRADRAVGRGDRRARTAPDGEILDSLFAAEDGDGLFAARNFNAGRHALGSGEHGHDEQHGQRHGNFHARHHAASALKASTAMRQAPSCQRNTAIHLLRRGVGACVSPVP